MIVVLLLSLLVSISFELKTFLLKLNKLIELVFSCLSFLSNEFSKMGFIFFSLALFDIIIELKFIF